MRRWIFSLVATAVLIAGTAAWAAPTLVSGSTPVDPIGQQIDTKDATRIRQAVANIWDELHGPSAAGRKAAVQGLARQRHWLDGLMKAGRYDEVARLSQEAAAPTPGCSPSAPPQGAEKN
jgi:hypothetical protein